MRKPPLTIRLAYFGCRNRPFFHIVASKRRVARNRGYYEQIGTYDPLPNVRGEKLVSLNLERIKYWLAMGALPSTPVLKLLGLAGVLPIHPRTYVEAANNREERAKANGEEAESRELPREDKT